ncbi:Hypothetical predicted protein [Drosophila guanche]|uniref:Uncharacterized protein n=1 Tax=Drosophila guanche TaxID=7266 RepID=A0A3B0KJT4_DROGU|nr:Hypothetical predicted protein [Drosophila guanche]
MFSEMQQARNELEERRRRTELRIGYGNARSAMNMRGSRQTVKIQTPSTDIVMRHRIANPIASLEHCLPMYCGYGYHLDRCLHSPSLMQDLDLEMTVGERDRNRFEPIVCEALPKTPSNNRYPMIRKLKSKLKSKLTGTSKNQSNA